MKRMEAVELIKSKVPNENLCRHMIAVGAIMRALASRFDCDPDLWELAGILHDIDLGTTDDPAIHGKLGAEWLADMKMPEELVNAVLSHAGHRPCQSSLDTVLFSGDQLSGLITACALVKGRKLENVTPKTIRKRFKEKRFAAGADREAIRQIESLGVSLEEFYETALSAMQTVSDELGL